MSKKMVYEWKPGSKYSVDATVTGKHLEKLRRINGEITPDIVVEDATATSSPLHKLFEWDNDKAAGEYRKAQARQVINHLVIRVTEEEGDKRTVRAFVNVIEDSARTYTPIHVAMADPDLRAQVIEQCVRELEGVRDKFRHLNEFAGVWSAIDRIAIQPPAPKVSSNPRPPQPEV